MKFRNLDRDLKLHILFEHRLHHEANKLVYNFYSRLIC